MFICDNESVHLAKFDAKAAATIQGITEDNICRMKHAYNFMFRSTIIYKTKHAYYFLSWGMVIKQRQQYKE
jgi:hypothetical protein